MKHDIMWSVTFLNDCNTMASFSMLVDARITCHYPDIVELVTNLNRNIQMQKSQNICVWLESIGCLESAKRLKRHEETLDLWNLSLALL